MSETFERDPIIERVRAALRDDATASPDARAVARVLQAVWSSPVPSRWQRFVAALRVTSFTRMGVASVAGAALLIGFFTGDAVERDAVERDAVASDATARDVTPIATGAGADPATAAGVRVDPAANVADGVVAVPTQFVLDRAGAVRVSIVGDFNDWKAGATPLVRLANGLWTTTIPLPPGRHVYAFVLDDTLLVADPRAPKAGDADYGREGSVVMVFAR